ncbi:hypothetical protein KJ742_03425, partial [Patescibacteria group bacterium]|nr:hypothetical protein [Patescibacteria group bacterium]
MKNEKLRQGFSLVEVLFTIAFLSVIIFGVIKLQTSNLTLTNAQNNEIKAHFLANQGVEIVEGVGVAGIGACGPPCTKYINFDGSDYSLIDADNNPFEDDFDLTIEIETAGTAGDYL